MPIDYKKYPSNWKTEIRPAILERDGHCCKFCKAPNYTHIFRGIVRDGVDGATEIYQFADGSIHRADSGEALFDGVGVAIDVQPLSGDPLQPSIKIVLTIAHLDHDITNNDYDNLAALCQRCHLRHDAQHHAKNSKTTRETKKQAKTGQISMF